jgi:DNA-binding beta-propeller fold protein YncE
MTDRLGCAGRAALVLFLSCFLAATLPALGGGMEDEFRIDRKEGFEFAEPPSVTCKGDRVTIRFKTKAFCDVTVAIEDTDGRILRHLACGVLGPNAPDPFKKNSLEQTLVWDGKDDQGRYVDDLADVHVRVSLGLKARFERPFLWDPHRRITPMRRFNHNLPSPIAVQPEGVYVYDSNMFDHLRLFDHQGRYKRTIYPFPADKVDELVGVRKHTFPQSGKTLPLKGGRYQTTLLTSGTTSRGGYAIQRDYGRGATAMAVGGGRIAIAMQYLNRLATDGSTGGLPLEGPRTTIEHRDGIWTKNDATPRSAAFSPDGKTLYLAGFFGSLGGAYHLRAYWAHGVMRIDMAAGAKRECFAGSLKEGKQDKDRGGTRPGQFRAPTSVATDPQGRVYVADHFNNRVQIFDPSGRHLKSISVKHPSEVCVNARNGDIYVFCWPMSTYDTKKSGDKGFSKVARQMIRFGPFDNPKRLQAYPLPVRDGHKAGGCQGIAHRALIDPWYADAEDPSVWLFDREGQPPRIYRIDRKKQKLVPVVDFRDFSARAIPAMKTKTQSLTGVLSMYGRLRMAVNHRTGELFAARYGKNAGDNPFVVNPKTGRVRLQPLPFGVDEMAFDLNGHAYLRRGGSMVVRYELAGDRSWRQVPFDYGEQHGDIISALVLPGGDGHHQGGLWVAPNGHIAVAYYTVKGWKPEVYRGRPGRKVIVSVFDRHGQVVRRDALPGVPNYLDGLFLDRDGRLYAACHNSRHGYFSRMTGTLVKARPGTRALVPRAPVPLRTKPNHPQQMDGAWWENAEWFYGGMGYAGKIGDGCNCPHYRPTHDCFARTFVPETQHYSVAVLDSSGNLILRIGQYGNADDGVPLVKDEKVEGWQPRSIGGDEVGLFYPAYLATHTDRRLFIQDPGNRRLVSVKLGYHAEHRTALKDVAADN